MNILRAESIIFKILNLVVHKVNRGLLRANKVQCTAKDFTGYLRLHKPIPLVFSSDSLIQKSLPTVDVRSLM